MSGIEYSVISEKKFAAALFQQLGTHWEEAFDLFKKYGPVLSFDFTNTLLYAVDKNRVPEVLRELNKHFNETLASQHPEARGLVTDRLLGVDKTAALFYRIWLDYFGIDITKPKK